MTSFSKHIEAILFYAALVDRQITEPQAAYLAKKLSIVSVRQLADALEHFVDRGKWPTVEQLRAKCGVSVTDAGQTSEQSQRKTADEVFKASQEELRFHPSKALPGTVFVMESLAPKECISKAIADHQFGVLAMKMNDDKSYPARVLSFESLEVEFPSTIEKAGRRMEINEKRFKARFICEVTE